MSTAAFLFAVWALLLTPGPTNTLLAVSGAAVGLRRSVRLMPVELAAYLLVTCPLAVFGAEFLAGWPEVARVIKFAAAAWVAVLAVRLWRMPAPGPAGAAAMVTQRQVFITTLLNPKALIIGLALLPTAGMAALPLHVALFAASVVAVASLWAGLGAGLRRGATSTLPPLARRAAACWLAVLAATLLGAGFSA